MSNTAQKIWKVPVSPAMFNQRNAGTLATLFQIEFVEVTDSYAKATMPVTAQLWQPNGIMNGGVSCVLAETVGSTAANYCLNPLQEYCVGIDINTNHIRAVRSGTLGAVAKPFHIGRLTQVWSIEVFNEKGEIVSVTRLTLAVLPIKAR